MRSSALKKLTLLKKEHEVLEAELAAYGDSNPAKVEELKRAIFLGKEAAYRWTGSFLSVSCEEIKIQETQIITGCCLDILQGRVGSVWMRFVDTFALARSMRT